MDVHEPTKAMYGMNNVPELHNETSASSYKMYFGDFAMIQKGLFRIMQPDPALTTIELGGN